MRPLVAALLVATLPSPAAAQAWVQPAGAGAISVSFQTIDHTGHRLTDGTYIDNGRSRTGSVFVEVDYGVTRRLSLSVGLPFVFARYTDDDPPPPFLPFLPVDQCRCWNSGFQDVGLMARFNVVDTFDHVLWVTPSVSVGIPSTAYDYRGEAVIGRRLRETDIGIDASRRLDMISPNLTVSGHYAYAIVEDVLDVPNNRSNATIAADWRIGPPLTVRGFVWWQRTHGGLRAGSLPGSDFEAPGDLTTADRIAEHDRLLRDNSTHVGGGVTYRLSRLDVFATYARFVAGTDTHAGWALTSGVTVPFRVRQ